MAKLLQERAEVEKRLAKLEEFSSSDESDGENEFTKSDVLRQVNYLPLMKIEKKNKKEPTESKKIVEKTTKIEKEVPKNVVYIGRVPHGFYEPQMFKFLKQFGTIKGLKLARSKKTGKSRGYAFVKFTSSEVAQIVVQSLNGYMIGDKTLICKIADNPQKLQRIKLRTRAVNEEKIVKRNNTRLLAKYKNFSKLKASKLKSLAARINTIAKNKENSIKKQFGVDYKIPITDIQIQLSGKAKEKNQNTKQTICGQKN